MRYLRPLVDPATYRGWLWLIIGGALVMPFVLLGEVVYVSLVGIRAGGLVQISPQVFVSVLPLVALSGAFVPVGQVSVFLARTLLRADGLTDSIERRSWDRRVRDAAWLTIHLGVGGLLSGVTLALMPFLVMVALLPALPEPAIASSLLDAGWDRAWGPVVAPVVLAAFVYLVAGASALMRHLARYLLGPTAAEQLAASRAGMRRLAERNRIARELHDSVGHSLSVVTVQADAASHVLRTDPDFAQTALSSIADQARRALEELDQVLRVLREDDGDSSPSPATLDDLPDLLADSGLVVSAHLDDRAASLPAHLSREAYRIVQETLTNALRYGDGTADLAVTVADGWVGIQVGNPVAADRSPGHGGRGRTGFGRAGLDERVAILGGTVTSGESDGHWTVVARFPIPSDA